MNSLDSIVLIIVKIFSDISKDRFSFDVMKRIEFTKEINSMNASKTTQGSHILIKIIKEDKEIFKDLYLNLHECKETVLFEYLKLSKSE